MAKIAFGINLKTAAALHQRVEDGRRLAGTFGFLKAFNFSKVCSYLFLRSGLFLLWDSVIGRVNEGAGGKMHG